jgi:uncharacterized protein YwqG
MNTEEILQQLAPWREAHKRTAWTPIVEEKDGEATASKFSGMPWLAEDEPYPCCRNCQTPMPLLLQLNLADLPAELTGKFGSGLLQLFYCTGNYCDGGWEPFSGSKLVRLVQPSDRTQSLSAGSYPTFPAKTIVGWTPFDDYPNSEEHDELGLIFNYDFSAQTLQIQCPSVGLETEALPMEEAPEAEEVASAATGDKLGGYPDWVQGIEYPDCPECNRRMELVFQLDSEDHLPFMFGDMGCGHITQCPEHKHVVTFAWACS